MAERELYRAVLEQATEDICNGDTRALDWIHSHSCIEFCQFAGVDYGEYLERTEKITRVLARRTASRLLH